MIEVIHFYDSYKSNMRGLIHGVAIEIATTPRQEVCYTSVCVSAFNGQVLNPTNV